MSEYEPDAEVTTDTELSEKTPKRRKPWWLKLLIGLGVTIVVLALLAATLYYFGGMSGSVYDPELREQYTQMVAAGQVKPVEKRFVIGIPGCQCHSKDPYLTEQHRNRRMSQCGGCHSGGRPR